MNSSATTSTSAHAAEPSPALSEAEFLKQEAARAQAAIGHAFADLKQNLKATVDPHVLTRDHPWIAVSAAAVAGFATALTMVPTKEQQALRALAELERARHAPPPARGGASDKHEAEGVASAGILATIAAELLKTLRPVLTTLLTAGITRAASGAGAGSSGEDGTNAAGNGHATSKDVPGGSAGDIPGDIASTS